MERKRVIESMFRVVKKLKQEHTGHDRNGDVFIVQRDKKVHDAGVYLDGQIVQLKRTFFNHTEIGKINVDGFTGGNRFAIYRKISEIPRSFKENVEEAMSRRLENNFSEYNCIEFVLELLEIYLAPTESDCKKISFGAKPKGFNVVKGFSDEYSGNAKLGDLFIVQSGISVFESYYAGVCCHEKGPEIIQFTSQKIGLLVTSVVNKVHMNTFSADRKFAIYRKKTGIPDSFKKKVDEAMSKMPQNMFFSYDSVQFALELLENKLEKTERDVESLTEQVFGGLSE